MDIFEIVVGLTSIGSFIIAIIALFKIEEIRNYTSLVSKNKVKQTIEDVELSSSEIKQTGRDTRN